MTDGPTGTEPFGGYLIIDGYRAAGPLKTDAVASRGIPKVLPAETGMHRICTRVVVAVGPNCRKDTDGLSGSVMIAESHISRHTFPGRGFVAMDLRACQLGLDRQGTIDWLLRAVRLSDRPRSVLSPLEARDGRQGFDASAHCAGLL